VFDISYFLFLIRFAQQQLDHFWQLKGATNVDASLGFANVAVRITDSKKLNSLAQLLIPDKPLLVVSRFNDIPFAISGKYYRHL